MKTVKVEMFLVVNADAVGSIKKFEHHAEYYLDLDAHPEIKNVYGVRVKEITN